MFCSFLLSYNFKLDLYIQIYKILTKYLLMTLIKQFFFNLTLIKITTLKKKNKKKKNNNNVNLLTAFYNKIFCC